MYDSCAPWSTPNSRSTAFSNRPLGGQNVWQLRALEHPSPEQQPPASPLLEGEICDSCAPWSTQVQIKSIQQHPSGERNVRKLRTLEHPSPDQQPPATPHHLPYHPKTFRSTLHMMIPEAPRGPIKIPRERKRIQFRRANPPGLGRVSLKGLFGGARQRGARGTQIGSAATKTRSWPSPSPPPGRASTALHSEAFDLQTVVSHNAHIGQWLR